MSLMSYAFINDNNDIGQTYTNYVSNKAGNLNYNISVCYKQVQSMDFFISPSNRIIYYK